ncbi:MAG: protein kinase [Verrucomicrobiota bacterium]|nr:protein kinase [Verrucomicrobiota bacterium]
MERTTFLEHYRLCQEDGSPVELSRSEELVTYKAVDTRFNDTVAIKRIPVAKVEPAAREEFEKQALTARVLDHVNITKLLGFGVEDDHFVFVSEYLDGETVDSWIAAHGPMPPEAVLRIALQVLSALRAARFHGLMHRAIQPPNLIIVPGQTAEGGWPFVKLTNFGLAGLPLDLTRGATPAAAAQFASPEELQSGTVDFRSEIYSLGATMCFLLSGSEYSVESRLQQIRRFPKPIRDLLAHMLRDNPDERPQDPVVFEEAIRQAITKVERRQEIARKFGIPLVPVTTKKVERPRALWPRRAVAVAAILLTLTALGAVFLPEDLISVILHRNPDAAIGVPVGVPESPATPVVKNSSPIPAPVLPPSPASSNQVNTASVQSTPAISNQPLPVSPPAVANANQNTPAVPPSPVSQSAPPENAPMSASSGSVVTAAPNASSNQITAITPVAEPEPPTEGPDTVWTRAAGSNAQPKLAEENADTGGKVESQDAATPSRSTASTKSSASSRTASKQHDKTKSEAATSERSARRRNVATTRSTRYQSRSFISSLPQGSGSFHAQFLGTAPDGRWILGLPSGDTTLVRPPSSVQYAPEPSHRRTRRVIFERRRTFVPPVQPFLPMPPPDA